MANYPQKRSKKLPVQLLVQILMGHADVAQEKADKLPQELIRRLQLNPELSRAASCQKVQKWARTRWEAEKAIFRRFSPTFGSFEVYLLI